MQDDEANEGTFLVQELGNESAEKLTEDAHNVELWLRYIDFQVFIKILCILVTNNILRILYIITCVFNNIIIYVITYYKVKLKIF